MQSVVGKFAGSVTALAAPLAAALSFGKVISETKEAQAALAQLDIAFQNSAESAKRSKQEMLDFSDAAQRATTFSDESITRAQTALLRFSRVSGDTFGRARKDILDVAAALGTDLETAAFSVGRALQSPSQGLRQLRALGVIFTESQQKLIKSLEGTGQVAKAQEILLQALEDRFAGAAEAARNTLGGALQGLEHAFGDLFESTDEGANAAASGINELSAVIADPQFKQNIQTLTGELLSFAAAFVSVTAKAIYGLKNLAQYAAAARGSLAPKHGVDALFDKQSNLGRSLDDALAQRDRTLSSVQRRAADELVNRIRAEIKKVQDELNTARQGQGRGQGIGSHQASRPGGSSFISDAEAQRLADDEKAQAAARTPIDLVNITASRSFEAQKLLREFNESTRTSLEQANADFDATFSKLSVLFKEGIIDMGEWEKRLSTATIKYNEAVEIDPVKVSVHKVTEELSGQQLRIHQFIETLKEGLANLAQSGQLTGRAIVRYLLAALESKLIYKAIEALGAALSKALAKAASGGGASGSVATVLGSIFGHAAGGGRMSGVRIVGEDGPELDMGGGNILNLRQLAFAGAGMGGGVTLNTSNVWNIDGSASPEATAQYVETRLQQSNKRLLDQLNQRMKDSYGRGLR